MIQVFFFSILTCELQIKKQSCWFKSKLLNSKNCVRTISDQNATLCTSTAVVIIVAQIMDEGYMVSSPSSLALFYFQLVFLLLSFTATYILLLMLHDTPCTHNYICMCQYSLLPESYLLICVCGLNISIHNTYNKIQLGTEVNFR